MQPGIYILLLYGRPADIRIGSRGTIAFPEGFYAYVGSALGSGGLARLSRHIRLSRERNRDPRWHIDYLLLDDRFTLIRAYCIYTSSRLECSLAQGLFLPDVAGFGSSDCSCHSHLFYSVSDPDTVIREACISLGSTPVIHLLP